MPACKTMKAAVIEAPGRISMQEVPVPEPSGGQVRIRVEGSGVCASNLGPWGGLPWMAYPLGPGEGGHEGWGVVDAVGEDVDGLREGQRVAFLSNRAWAAYDVAEADQVIPLPEELGDVPFPGEPFGCGVNVFRRSRIEPGDVVAVVGVGFIGAVVTRLAAEAGATVIGISRRESSLALARTMGATHTIPMHDHYRIIEEVKRLTDGRMCDRVVEAVGLQWPLDLAAELTRERGTLIIAGYHQDGPRQVNMQLWNWRGFDVINAHERDPAVYRSGIEAAVQAVVSGRLDPRAVITHTYALDELAAALDATANKPDGFVKAVVLP